LECFDCYAGTHLVCRAGAEFTILRHVGQVYFNDEASFF